MARMTGWKVGGAGGARAGLTGVLFSVKGERAPQRDCGESTSERRTQQFKSKGSYSTGSAPVPVQNGTAMVSG